MLDKYLNKDELDKIIDEAKPKDKANYKIFDLHPSDKESLTPTRNRGDKLRTNSDDPYFNKYMSPFQ